VLPITDRVSTGGNAIAFVCPSVCLFPLYLSNRLTFDLDLHVYGSLSWLTGDWNWRSQDKVSAVGKLSTSIEGRFSSCVYAKCCKVKPLSVASGTKLLQRRSCIIWKMLKSWQCMEWTYTRQRYVLHWTYQNVDAVYTFIILTTVIILSAAVYCYFAPGRGAKYCDKYVCLSICPLAYPENLAVAVELYQICYACCLWPWLGLDGAPLWYVMYIRFCGWRHVFT